MSSSGGGQLSSGPSNLIGSRKLKKLQASSRHRTESDSELQRLPKLKSWFFGIRVLQVHNAFLFAEAPRAEQADLMIQKLRQCQILFDFRDPVA